MKDRIIRCTEDFQTYKDLKWLEDNALWMIVDPWADHPFPKDLQRDPNINEHNRVYVDKIAEYLPNLQHVITSCYDRYPVVDEFAHLYNIHDKHSRLFPYMKDRNLTTIVYLGFHHGRCILNRTCGAIRLRKQTEYDLYLKRDMVCTLSYDDETLHDAKSRKFLTFV